jgi:drug/metabolite transporter (DMT)-like permease
VRKFLAFAAVYLIWGSTYLAIGVGVQEIPPFLMAGVRFVTAGAILFLIARRGEAPLTRREWAEAGLAGLLFFTAAHGLGHWAQVRIPSGAAAVLVATVVFWITGLDAAFVARKRPSLTAVFCTVAGFSGVVVLVAPWRAEAPLDPAGVIAMLLGPVAWATASLWSRRPSMPRCLPLSAGAQMLVGGAALVTLGTASGQWSQFSVDEVGFRALAALVYLVVFGSIVAFVAYTWLLAHVEPALAATYAFVNPLIAVLLGGLLLGEDLSPRVWLALGLIVVPVALLQWNERRIRPALAGGAGRPPSPPPDVLHVADGSNRPRRPGFR